MNDTYQWKCGWAAWRIRFHYDNDVVDQTFARICALVRDHALPLCRGRAEACAIALYVASREDVIAVYTAFDHGLPGPGQISGMQSRIGYLEAAQLAVELVEIDPVARFRADPEAVDRYPDLPDFRWAVSGMGPTRVAAAQVEGRRVLVRLRMVNGGEVWSVDVDDKQGCAHFRNRADALSKMGVVIALRAFDAEAERPVRDPHNAAAN